jgi:signal transduction histidine kinase
MFLFMPKFRTHISISIFVLFLLSTLQLDAQTIARPALLTLQENSFFDVFLTGLTFLIFEGIGIVPLGIISLLVLVIVSFWFWIAAKNRELKNLQKEVKNLTQKNNAKDKFFSIIGHDLKSPFNSLMGLSEMLVLHTETMNHTEVLNYSKMVHQSTGKLYALVENLLQRKWSCTLLARQTGTTSLNIPLSCLPRLGLRFTRTKP